MNHLLIASETISTEDIWEPLAEGDLIGIMRSSAVRQRPLDDGLARGGVYKRDGQIRHARAIGRLNPVEGRCLGQDANRHSNC